MRSAVAIIFLLHVEGFALVNADDCHTPPCPPFVPWSPPVGCMFAKSPSFGSCFCFGDSLKKAQCEWDWCAIHCQKDCLLPYCADQPVRYAKCMEQCNHDHPIAAVHFTEEASKRNVKDSGHSFAVAYADIDADGDVDMFITNSGSSNLLYINDDGKGSFKDATTASGIAPGKTSRGAVFADVNGDGKLDLYVTDSTNPNTLYLGDGQGHFKDASVEAGVDDRGFGQGACFADVDGDEDLDLFVANFGQGNALYINKGNGIFDNATLTSGLALDGIDSFGCAFGDIDEDGVLDLYVTNAGSYNKLYSNNGKGVFTDITDKAGVAADKGQGRGVSFADFNGDGHLDLYMVSPASKHWMFFGDGTGNFTDHSEEAGVAGAGPAQGLNVADVDGDGDLDILVSNILTPSTLYINNGKGHFTNEAAKSKVDYHLFGQGVAFADINGDGGLDAFVATWGTPPLGSPSQASKLLINQDRLLAWLKVRPVTKDGHATLLGTEVRLFEAGTRKAVGVRMQIDGGSGFASQNAYDAYFGLAAYGLPDSPGPYGGTFDVEVRCGGSWTIAAKAVSPNQVVSVHCSKSSMLLV